MEEENRIHIHIAYDKDTGKAGISVIAEELLKYHFNQMAEISKEVRMCMKQIIRISLFAVMNFNLKMSCATSEYILYGLSTAVSTQKMKTENDELSLRA